MKRLVSLITALLLLAFLPLASFGEEEAVFGEECRSVILVEASTGRVLYQSNPDEPLPPASVTKIMTLLLVMEAIDEGRIALTDLVSVSERAANMGGSQVYLEPGEEMSVDELVKCVAVASANDAATALAEHVSGSLESFVAAMNRRAAELGMAHTHFENANGLDDTAENHVTSASDIAVMSAELLKHREILRYTTIWMDTVRNGAFGLTNTNRLIRFYKGANGLKTGSTAKAGFCISATAERDGMQLIAVVMGAPTRDIRNAVAAKLLDYGFAGYELYKTAPPQVGSLPVNAGKADGVRLIYPASSFVLPKGAGKKVTVKIELPESVSAPVEAGQTLGTVTWTLGDETLSSGPVTAAESVGRLTAFDIFKELFGLYTAF